jgi:hypothetical protein
LWTGKCLEGKHTGKKNHEYYQQYWFFHNYLLVRSACDAADDLEPTGRQKQFLSRDLKF